MLSITIGLENIVNQNQIEGILRWINLFFTVELIIRIFGTNIKSSPFLFVLFLYTKKNI